MTIVQEDAQTITIESAVFHLPYADLLPPLDPETRAALRASIAQHGIKTPLLVELRDDGTFDVIDGQHRLIIAGELNLPLDQIPLEDVVVASEDDRLDLALATNLYRRHLTREQRQALALKLRQQGKSYRAIAGALGTSPATAQRDIDAAGVSNETPEGRETGEPGLITGADGKQYPARRTEDEPPPGPLDTLVERAQNGNQVTYTDAQKAVWAAQEPPEHVLAAIRDYLAQHTPPAGKITVSWLKLSGAWAKDLAPALAWLAAQGELDDRGDHYTLNAVPAVEESAPEPEPAPELTDTQRAAASILDLFAPGQRIHYKDLVNAANMEHTRYVKAINFLLGDRSLKQAGDGYYLRPEPSTPPKDPDRVVAVMNGTEITAQAVDELKAKFDRDAITLAGETDDGAWHRAIEIARKLVVAGLWDGECHIEFDAYALHYKLFGVNRVEPSALVENDDYWFVELPAESAITDSDAILKAFEKAKSSGYTALFMYQILNWAGLTNPDGIKAAVTAMVEAGDLVIVPGEYKGQNNRYALPGTTEPSEDITPTAQPDPAATALLAALASGPRNVAALVAAGIALPDIRRCTPALVRAGTIRLDADNQYELVTPDSAPVADAVPVGRFDVYMAIKRGTHDRASIARKIKLSPDDVQACADSLVANGDVIQVVKGVWQLAKQSPASPPAAPVDERTRDASYAVPIRAKFEKALLDLVDAADLIQRTNGVASWYALGPDSLTATRDLIARAVNASTALTIHLSVIDGKLATMIETGQPYEESENSND